MSTLLYALGSSIDTLMKLDITQPHISFLIVIEQFNLAKQMVEFDGDNDQLPMFKWARMYICTIDK